MFLLVLIVIASLAYLFYKWAKANDNYFKNRGVKYVEPKFLVGNTGDLFFNRVSATDYAQSIYNQFPDETLYGMFDFRVPQYLIHDPEVIRKVCIKDFDHFEDHRVFMDETIDALWANNLFFMTGHKWRLMRNALSPAFTGSKMRTMFGLISDVVSNNIEYFQKKVKNGEKIDIEMKEFFGRYSSDVIASCAFGLKVDSLENPNNEFIQSREKMMDFTSFWQVVKLFLINKFPFVMRLFNIKFSDRKTAQMFHSIILDTMETRKRNNIFRPDMINIMMQVREGTSDPDTEYAELKIDNAKTIQKWSDDDIVAQCFVFFLAGFETVSTLLTFAAYELLANQDIQEKLYNEIVETHEQLGGKPVDYDTLQKMVYMDQVINETLRKWPPNAQVDRVCNKDHIFEDGKGLKFKMEKDVKFILPMYGIQHDAKYFPDPERFDPDRFSEERKKEIVPGTFIPFGIGPRSCIGNRFALMEIKAILYNLLLHFSFETTEKSDIPIKLLKNSFVMVPANGVHLELKPRNK